MAGSLPHKKATGRGVRMKLNVLGAVRDDLGDDEKSRILAQSQL